MSPSSYRRPAARPAVDPDTLARFDALSPDERARVARLCALTGCSIEQGIAAVEATRPALASPSITLADVAAARRAAPPAPSADPWDDGPEPYADTPMSPERAAQIDSWLKSPPPPPPPLPDTSEGAS